ncbi:MAG: PilZ domain-containing protein [Pseudomonadota bacterium]
MTEREPSAKLVLNDLLSGLDDAALREKYKLSAQGLDNLVETLVSEGLVALVGNKYVVPGKTIHAGKILNDILSGFTGTELMEKFGLSPQGLQTVLKKLVHSRVLGIADLGLELYLRLEAVVPENIRTEERLRLEFEVSICDVDRPDTMGTIRDISEKGVGTIGIEAKVDEIKTLMVMGDVLGQISPFVFKARCRWSACSKVDGNRLAGFHIIRIPERDLLQLRRLVELTTL